MKQRIAFLYLNTGGGHVAPARALSSGLAERYPETDETHLFNGFSQKMRVCRFFFEDGYQISSNYFEASYVLFYRMTEIPQAIRFGNYFVSIHGEHHLARFFREKQITKVVCLHEILLIIARKALARVNPDASFITLVTDPFTAHGLWFYVKDTELVVFSQKLRKEAIEKHGFVPQRVHTFPFILNPAFDRVYTDEEKRAVRSRLGIAEDQKVLLIAGGGEGLKSADRIVAHYLRDKSYRSRNEVLLVVCGRNRLLKMQVQFMADRSRSKVVRVFGFVSFMPDLLNIADCVITKGGASTVMEVLAVGKPVIFSTFIRGQELGNVLYVVTNGAGWYLKKPKEILGQARAVLDNPELATRIRQNIARLGVRNGLYDVMRFIHEWKQ